MKASLVQQDLHKILQRIEGDGSKGDSTIQLCLTDEVMYNVMDEETHGIVVKVRDVIYDEKPLQQAVSQETTYGLHMNEEQCWSI